MSFSDLPQHPDVVAQLQRSLRRGRLAHAYLFVGPRGSGKEAVARTLAQALNCLKKTHDACDACDSCRRIAAGNHPDIYWVRPESKSRRITVEQVREFEQAANFKAGMARVKVGIIVDADCMGEEASNAFLKTLEEPPAQTIILLLTAEPQRLLPTVLSRCLRVNLGAAAGAVSPYRPRVVPMLARFANGEEWNIAGVYQLHAQLTGLLAALKQEIRQALEAESDAGRAGELDPKVVERLQEQAEARVEGQYRAAREQVVEELYGWFADVLLCVEQADAGLLEHPEQLPALRRLAERWSPARAAANLDAVDQIRESLARNVNETLALEVGLLRLAQAPGM